MANPIKYPFAIMGEKICKHFNIEINHSLPYISVEAESNSVFNNVPTFFSQGEDAQNMLDEIPKDANSEHYILGMLESSGWFI